MAAEKVLEALQVFADAVQAKMAGLFSGEPEDQLRGPFETLLVQIGQALGWPVLCVGEPRLPGRLGKPDYAVHSRGLLSGFAELKAPGSGVDPNRFRGHDLEQFRRFRFLPNLLYTDGNQWALYHQGQLVRPMVRLCGDVVHEGRKAVTAQDAEALLGLIRDFLAWTPMVPHQVSQLAELLAPVCRMLRGEVVDALKASPSPLLQLAQDWRQLLFPEASDEQFADAYAQTVTFALLLARSEGAEPLSLESAVASLAAGHSLLSRALQVLTDPAAQQEISASLKLLLRIIGHTPQSVLKSPGNNDPWLFFYEDFLAVYDPQLRRNAGAYYTPVEVVRAQVRLIDALLAERFQKPLGFADPEVVTLDPAVGTGTYLLAVIEHALSKVEVQQGRGAMPAKATELAKNLYGFEIMVGPYAVAELRVSRSLADKGATLPPGGVHIYLTDTLESPYTEPPRLPLFLKPLADQHTKALKVKNATPVLVCLGNPPYDRHEAAEAANKARTGHWVRWGDDGSGKQAIFNDFLQPVLQAGYGVHVKNLYNMYVYFWRWALWKVFESPTAQGPGVVSFISASSYLEGDAFCGMREHMRRLCDEIWILDLGGEGRGARRSENVFDIQTPVAVAIAVRYGKKNLDAPARVYYARIEGTREEKLRRLEKIKHFRSLRWQNCPSDWQAPFRPAGKGLYFTWPLLTDLFPWQHSGVEMKRTWPIAPSKEVLEARWKTLLREKDRAKAFKETRDRKIAEMYSIPGTEKELEPISQLSQNAPPPTMVRYGYRFLDRQWLLADIRLGDYMRPPLWAVRGPKQVFLTTLLNHPIGRGPAVVVTPFIPDRHHYRGSFGGKDVLPLYRDAEAEQPNLLPGLLELLAQVYRRRSVKPEDFFAYVYGVLAAPAFAERFTEELATRQIRLPLTKQSELFDQLRRAGAKLLSLHTFGRRFVPKGQTPGHIPPGQARCTNPIPSTQADYPDGYSYDPDSGTLRVGSGEFTPVGPEVYEFEVSGFKVLQSWLGYRMRRPRGKKSSPLDKITQAALGGWPAAFTTELLELLWVLEATVAEFPRLQDLLRAILTSPCLEEEELRQARLLPAPPAARKPPPPPGTNNLFNKTNTLF